MLMPSMLPIEVYQASGRDKTMGEILFRFEDNRGREFALGPTHEELFAEVFKRNVQSYRDMPLLVYQIASKFRDEPRPRGGLIRLRQFIMKDLYSFDSDWEGLDVSYQKMYDAYQRIFDRCGVPTVAVLADSGAMGGKDTHQFTYLTEYGEDTALICPGCGYAADSEVAALRKDAAHSEEEPKPLEEVDTPGMRTIAELAEFLGVPETRTAKAVFYGARLAPEVGSQKSEVGSRGSEVGEKAVLVVIRGDMEVNEVKLKNALGALELVYMDEEAVGKAGFVAGSAGAVGIRRLKPEPGEQQGAVTPLPSRERGSGLDNLTIPQGERVIVVADELVTRERNLVAGANVEDKHLLNTNYGRDWEADVVADIALAGEGSPCANCGTAMDARRGIEMGQVFKLGDGYGEKIGAYFLDAEGQQKPPIMGSYGIGVERLLAAIIEANHDDKGIVWPRELAPFDLHIVAIQADKAGVGETAERLYEELASAGLRVLYDDRDETPGVKFNDADLLGTPLRVTVSPRNMEKGGVEVKGRTEAEARVVGLDAVAAELSAVSRRPSA
jgi:prolyl-tRNA synthetase